LNTPLQSNFDKAATERDRWIRKNRYYNQKVADFYRFHIPMGSIILELGCGTGFLLNALKPKVGVGVDFNPKMIELAAKNHSHLTFIAADVHEITLEQKFDYIIISDSVGYFQDIQKVFNNLSKFCTENTRIIITNYNFLWEPILKTAEVLRLKMKEPFTSWLNIQDMSNLLNLENFEVLKTGREILFPKNIPIISWFLNKYIAHLPVINHLNLMNFIIARPVNITPIAEKSVSIVVAARNEAGHIEEIIKRIPEFSKKLELIFIEGGSTDNTYNVIKEEADKYKGFLTIKYARQDGKGKGDAVRKGFDMAENDILMILDADMTVPPEDLPKFYQAIKNNKGEFINGCRLIYPLGKESMRFLNILGNKGFSLIFTWLLDQKFKDTLCGTKVLTRENYRKLKENRKYFGDFDPFGDFDLIFGASKLNLKIVEIPVRYQRRIYGDTNISRFTHGWILLRMCIFAMRKIKFY